MKRDLVLRLLSLRGVEVRGRQGETIRKRDENDTHHAQQQPPPGAKLARDGGVQARANKRIHDLEYRLAQSYKDTQKLGRKNRVLEERNNELQHENMRLEGTLRSVRNRSHFGAKNIDTEDSAEGDSMGMEQYISNMPEAVSEALPSRTRKMGAEY